MSLPTYRKDPHRLALTLVRLVRSDNWVLATNRYRERVARAALLMDWAATGRLANEAEAVELDTSSTGNPGADALLAAVERDPGRSLDYWISARVPVVFGLAQQLRAVGVWRQVRSPLSHRYRDRRPDELVTLRRGLVWVTEDYLPSEPEMIALALLEQLVMPYPKLISTHLVNDLRCGSLTWVVQLVRDYFEQELPKFTPGPSGSGSFNAAYGS